MTQRSHPSFRPREARPADVTALAALHVATFSEAHGAGPRSPTRELREARWRSAVERETSWFCYLAEASDGRLIGLAKGTLHDGGIPGFQGELDRIYVLRDWHRRGLGHAGLASAYATVAEACGAHFLDAALVVPPSPTDGVHPDADGHRLLGEAIAKIVTA